MSQPHGAPRGRTARRLLYALTLTAALPAAAQTLFRSGFEAGETAPEADSGLARRPLNADCLAWTGPGPPPSRLSDTGCMDPADPTRPGPGLIPYDINVPFWSNGADKQRGFALPDDTTIAVDAAGDFVFPVGAVAVKSFTFRGRLVETRLLMHASPGTWSGFSYEWNAAGDDALLVPGSGKTVSVDGAPYVYPARRQCLVCHTGAAGRTLGLEIQQLNRPLRYPATGLRANQLSTYAAIGLLSAPLPAAPAALPALPRTDDPSRSLHDRSRAYLHSNCAGCHRPGGTGGGAIRLDYAADDDATGLCGLPPSRGDLGVDGARLLLPGDPSKSILSLRLATVGAGAMPPLAKTAADPLGVALIDAWIESLAGCD